MHSRNRFADLSMILGISAFVVFCVLSYQSWQQQRSSVRNLISVYSVHEEDLADEIGLENDFYLMANYNNYLCKIEEPWSQ